MDRGFRRPLSNASSEVFLATGNEFFEKPRISTIIEGVERGILKNPVIKYRIVVEGAGKMYDGSSGAEATRRFKQFVELSKKRRS